MHKHYVAKTQKQPLLRSNFRRVKNQLQCPDRQRQVSGEEAHPYVSNMVCRSLIQIVSLSGSIYILIPSLSLHITLISVCLYLLPNSVEDMHEVRC